MGLTKYNHDLEDTDGTENSLTSKMARLRTSSNAGNNGRSAYDNADDAANDYDKDNYTPPAPSLPRSSSSKLLGFVNRKRSNTTSSRNGGDFLIDPALHQADRNLVLSGTSTPTSRLVEHDTSLPPDLNPLYGAKPSAEQLSFAVKRDLAADALKDGLERAIAVHDYDGQEEGDLSMRQGDVIVITERSKSQDDWCAPCLPSVSNLADAFLIPAGGPGSMQRQGQKVSSRKYSYYAAYGRNSD
jgi:hypothetical protein